MANYEGESCSKCGKAFQPGDDIVVCPDCGAPYHRKCSKEIDQCVFHDKHGTSEAYQSKAQRDRKRREEETRKYDGRGELRCSRCGTLNPINGLFCEVCGTPLQKQVEQQQQENQRNQQGNGGFGPDFSFGGGGFGAGQQPFNSMPYNPFTTPFGGLNPDEEIDGIPVKDLAIFLGQNSHYYLPRFKQMKERNSNTWNWSALLFKYYYLFYRRLNWLGVLVFLIFAALVVPSLLLSFTTMSQEYSPDGTAIFDRNFLLMLYSAGSFLEIICRVFLGMFFNRLYMNHVFRKVRKLKAEYGARPDYHSMLLKNGSVSIKVIAAIAITTMVLIFASFFIMMALII